MLSVLRITLIELQRQLAYPVTFLLRISLPSVIKVLAVALLWRAILQDNIEGIGGVEADFIKVYSVLAPAIYIFLKTEPAFIMREIYDGTIQRYFTYPRPFLLVCLLRHFGFILTRIPEFLLVVFAVEFFLGGDIFTVGSIFTLFAFMLLSGLLLFSMFVATELVCMIIEEGWSLTHILDRLIIVASGSVIPVSLMPEFAQKILWLTPFPLIVYIPVSEVLSDEFSLKSALFLPAYIFWIGFFVCLSWLLYREGRKVYSPYGT